MRLFELRAHWYEAYDCPDNGKIKICGAYDTIAFAIDDDTKLKAIAEDLAAGHMEKCWGKRRSDHLRRLYPGYDDLRDTEYRIVDVSDYIIGNE